MPEPPKLERVSDQPISVILLAYNEETHVRDVVRAWASQLQKRAKPYQIVLVDDGSTDRTRELAEELAQVRPELRLIRHLTHRGLGAALRSGLEAAEHPLIATALCDPTYQPDDLPKFLAEIDKVHLVNGYRAGRPMPVPLRVVGWTWRAFLRVLLNVKIAARPGFLGWREHRLGFCARWLFGVRLRDVGCPFRLFRREAMSRCSLQSERELALIEQIAKMNYLERWISDEEIALDVPPSLGKWRSDFSTLVAEVSRLFSRPDFSETVFDPPAAPESPQPAEP